MREATCITTDDEPLLLESVKAQGRVVGRMLDMKLEQHFRNAEPKNVEIVYTFPLPWQAVLLGLEVELNGELLKGTVKAKSTARAEYEEALSEGDTGILVELNEDRSVTLELGNLMAGESCVIRLHYVQILQPEQGSLRLMLPTTIAPRYGDPVSEGGYPVHAVPEVDVTVEYPFDIQLTVQGELVQARIGSPTHKVSIQHIPAVGMPESHVTHIRLASQAWLDRDFVLVFDELAHQSLGLAARDRLDAGLGVVMASFTPKLPGHERLPVAMKVLVDCSGSMAGDSIQSARSALQRILASLQPEDRFSLSRFGSTVEHRSKALWKVAPAAMAAARRWAETLQADLGGTEMNGAILSTLALPGSKRCDVLLITDGDIHAIDAVIESAEQSGHRFFVVGIGSSVSEGLLRRLAQHSGGSCEFVAPGETVGPAIERLFARMRAPSVQDVRVEWPEGCQLHAAFDGPQSVFDGADVTVFARLHAPQAEALTGPVRLMGKLPGVPGEVCLAEVKPAFIADEANTLARLAAHQRYGQLRQQAEDAPTVLTRQLPALAEKYQLVTRDTSFILVKQRAGEEQATDMPQLRQVKGMLAAGFGGHGSVMASRMKFGKESPSVMYSMGSAQASSDPAVPSVWRTRDRTTAASKVDSLASHSVDDFEIPAFLRKDFDDGKVTRVARKLVDAIMPSKSRKKSVPSAPSHTPESSPTTSPNVWQFPPRTSDFWRRERDVDSSSDQMSARYTGLTPAGLAESLRINDRKLWPACYEELDTIGLGRQVIEWLEVFIAQGLDQRTVVRAFLDEMAGMDFTFRQTVASALRKRVQDGQPETPEIQLLKERIAKGLMGVEAETWPPSVLDFVEAEQESMGS